MPFLFVDYEQGSGGEFFCHSLSSEDGCILLPADYTPQGRYKVFDSYQQEFLKKYPTVSYKKSSDDFYDIIPAHRTTFIAANIGLNFKSIRIKFPTSKPCIDFVLYQRMTKVLLASSISTKYFLGEVKAIMEETKNKDWIKKTSPDMDNLSLMMLASNIDPTEENRSSFLKILLQDIMPEPDYNYDLTIEYENLIYNTDLVKQQIQEKFGITIKGAWLEKYKKSYDEYHSKT